METIEAKARWFQSLTLAQRMEVFTEFTNLALTLNPRLAEKGLTNPDQTLILRLPKEPGGKST
jgi:hypothetical protein